MSEQGDQKPRGRPEYKVYRSRPKLSDRLRNRDVQSLRKQPSKRGGGGDDMRRYRSGGGGGGFRDRFRRKRGNGGRRPWWKWVLIAAGIWVLISFLAFVLSAQIQTGKLSSKASDALSGGPFLLGGQNILILGGDTRDQAVGRSEPGASLQAPPRADTIMVLHAGLTSFRKLSIPRDTLAEVPGFGPQKINAGFSLTGQQHGDAALMIKTVESFLGVDLNHIVIVDFAGFVKFINALGGVTVHLNHRVCGAISGGKRNGGVTLKLKAGDHTLEGDKALALARIRENTCQPGETDLQRAQRQQLILNGIKDRLTDPLRVPYNFIHGPQIGWDAPKALISDMGGFTLPQLALAAIFGGSAPTNVLKPTGATAAGNLIVPQSVCEKAVRQLLGGSPPRKPACSPGG